MLVLFGDSRAQYFGASLNQGMHLIHSSNATPLALACRQRHRQLKRKHKWNCTARILKIATTTIALWTMERERNLFGFEERCTKCIQNAEIFTRSESHNAHNRCSLWARHSIRNRKVMQPCTHHTKLMCTDSVSGHIWNANSCIYTFNSG